MRSALDELARASRMSKASGSGKLQRKTAKQIESGRTARERLAMSLDMISEEMSDEVVGGNMTMAMVEASGVSLDRVLSEALRRDDIELARVLKSFVSKTRKAIAQAAQEASDELRR